VFCVWDELGAANVCSQDEMLCAAGTRIGSENLPGKDKFAVIDVEGDDPVVIVGSYNWTEAGACDNDENTLILSRGGLYVLLGPVGALGRGTVRGVHCRVAVKARRSRPVALPRGHRPSSVAGTQG